MRTHAHRPVGLSVFLKVVLVWMLALCWTPGNAQDLAEIRESGVLRHLGVPYARFVSGSGEGFDSEIVQLFAAHIGVRYEYVPAEWTGVIQDLIGQELEYQPTMRAVGSRPIRGARPAKGDRLLDSHFSFGGVAARPRRFTGSADQAQR